MNVELLCPRCMKEMPGDKNICPHCGFDVEKYKENISQHALKPLTILQGKYLVGAVIGEGGFGITYVGFDLNLEIRIAIKEFYPNGFVTRESTVTSVVTNYTENEDAEAQYTKWRENFVKEARSLAKFSNLPGIVHVRDFFLENNTAYIIMEYVDGITIKEYLKSHGNKISVDECLGMMRPVIHSLSKVHAEGIVHRDISPDNIMVQSDNEVKLIDFGAARDFSSQDEKSLSIMLKPGYAPEEQYRSKGDQGPWTDVYALCATIYRCITGEKPEESMERMREDTLKPPSQSGVQITPEQEKALMDGLAVYAEKRIRSMEELEGRLYSSVDPQSTGNAAVAAAAPAAANSAGATSLGNAYQSTNTINNPGSALGPGASPGGLFAGRISKLVIGITAVLITTCILLLLVIVVLLRKDSGAAQDTAQRSGVFNAGFQDGSGLGDGNSSATEGSEETVGTETAAETAVPEAEAASEASEETSGEYRTIRDLYSECMASFIRKNNVAIDQVELTEMNNDGIPELAINYHLIGKDGYVYNTQAVYGIRDGHVIRFFEATVNDFNLLIYRGGGETVTWFTRNDGDLYLVRNNGYEKFLLVDEKTGEYRLTNRYKYGKTDYRAAPGVDWTSPASREEVDSVIDRINGSMERDNDRYSVSCYAESYMSDHEIRSEAIDALERCQYANRLDDEMEVKWPGESERYGHIGMIYIVYQSLEGLNLHDTPDFDADSINYYYGPVGAGYNDNANGDVFYVVRAVPNSNSISGKLYLLDNGCYVSASEQMVAFIEF